MLTTPITFAFTPAIPLYQNARKHSRRRVRPGFPKRCARGGLRLKPTAVASVENAEKHDGAKVMPMPTTKGTGETHDVASETKQLFTLAAPNFVAQLTEPMASLADLYFIGRIGALPVAGVGVASAAYNTVCFAFAGLAYTTNAHIVAQDSHDGEKRAVISASVVALALGIAVSVPLALAAPQLVVAIGADATTASYAVSYIRSRAFGLPFTLLLFALTGAYRARHDLVRPLIASVLAASTNIVLDAALVPYFGVFGAGIATSISVTGATAYLAIMLRRHKPSIHKSLFRTFVTGWTSLMSSLQLKRENLWAILGPLIPLSFKRLFESMTFAMCCSAAARSGAESAAALEVARQTWNAIGIAWWPLGVSASVLIASAVARNRGQGKRRAIGIGTRAVGVVAILGCLGGLLVYANAAWIPCFFLHDPQYVSTATTALRWLALLLPISAVVDCLDSVMVALGEGAFVFKAVTAGAIACTLILAYNQFVGGVGLVLWALAMAIVIQAIFVLTKFWILYKTHCGSKFVHA